jgi:predicted nucleotidyltransferase
LHDRLLGIVSHLGTGVFGTRAEHRPLGARAGTLGAAGLFVAGVLGRSYNKNAMDRLPPDLAEVVAQLRKGLKELYGARFRDLLLYGSYAQGDQREGSDFDLLVLLDGPVDTGREILRIEPIAWPLSLDHGIVLSVMPVSHEAYQRGETSFLRIIRNDAMQAA